MTKFRHTITKAEIDSLLSFVPLEYTHTNKAGKVTCHKGYFVWKKRQNNNKIAGGFAGYVRSNNRYSITIKNKIYLAYHLVRILENKPPQTKFVIDHIDRNPLNNLPENLREITRSENSKNRGKIKNASSIYKGVNWHKVAKKWRAQFRFNGKMKYIGYFLNEKEAAIAVYNFCEKHNILDQLNFNQNLELTENFAPVACKSCQLKINLKRHLLKTKQQFKCCISDETDETKLRIHHLDNYIINHEPNKDLFYDLANVVILTNDLHVAYHKFAGKNFSKCNFKDWKNNVFTK